VSTLSGGNQQKLVVAREMDRHGRVLLAAQPTRGVDIGAVERIWQEVSARHQDYLTVMAESHKAYLSAAAALLGQAGAIPATPQQLPPPRAAAPQPQVYVPPAAPAPAASPQPPKANGSAGAHSFVPETPKAASPTPVPAPVAPAPRVEAPASKPASPAPATRAA